MIFFPPTMFTPRRGVPRRWPCMGIRGKETLNDSLPFMNNLAEP